MRSAGCASPKRFLHYGSKSLPCCSVLGRGVRCRGTSARCGISGSDHECTSHHSDWRSHYTHRSERLPLAHDPTFDAPGEYKLPHVTLKKGWLSWTAGTDGFAGAHGNCTPSNRKVSKRLPPATPSQPSDGQWDCNF